MISWSKVKITFIFKGGNENPSETGLLLSRNPVNCLYLTSKSYSSLLTIRCTLYFPVHCRNMPGFCSSIWCLFSGRYWCIWGWSRIDGCYHFYKKPVVPILRIDFIAFGISGFFPGKYEFSGRGVGKSTESWFCRFYVVLPQHRSSLSSAGQILMLYRRCFWLSDRIGSKLFPFSVS